MKWVWRFLLLVVLGTVLYAVNFLSRGLPIATGYAAKNMCSCVFLSERDPESIQESDLNLSFVKLVKTQIDYDSREVAANFYGFARQKARFSEGAGCTLLRGAVKDGFRISQTPHAYNPDTTSWPAGNLLADTIPANIDPARLTAAVQDAFRDDGPWQHGTRAVVIVYRDQIVAEKYREGFNADIPQLGWSMTKSVTNALTGILIKQGKLQLDEPAPIIEWKNDERKAITLDDLLQMESGLLWNEDYGSNSDVTSMLYKSSGAGEYAINKPQEFNRDTYWEYSSGTTNILMEIVERQFSSHQEFIDFPKTQLFDKIGMFSAVLEPDASGTYVGSSYMFATPRDWARFGLLFLHDGIWNGERILPEGWANYSVSPNDHSNGRYGAQFWLNAGGIYPSVPKDLFSCNGFMGQYVFVIPSRQLVVVRMGIAPMSDGQVDGFLRGILEALQ